MKGWSPVLPDVLRWSDSCNVYAVLGPDAALIVDAGTGEWLREGLLQLPVPPGALVLTHYFRDHAAGAALAAGEGIPVHVPEGERAILADPAEHFRRRESYLVYDNIWDQFAPIEPIPVAGLLRDYAKLNLAGIDLTVVPLPGVTPTQIGIVLQTPRSGRTVAFTAETIHSAGRVPRIAPLQYDYNDLLGVVNVAFSADLLSGLEPDLLLPSLGEPITADTGGALASLQRNLAAHVADRDYETRGLKAVGHDVVEPVTDRVWRSTQGRAGSHFVVGNSGRALILDYGYWYATGSGPVERGVDPILDPAYPFPERRRALLHSLDSLRERAGVEEYTAVVPTHYHDDHICGIPLLRRALGVPCWAPANFARLLTDPAGHRFPCTWPQPIEVDRELPLGESFEWDGISFRLEPMSGHTRFSALILWEVDGVRFAHVGDQYGPVDDQLPPSQWPPHPFDPNHVYRNGTFLDSFRRSTELLTEFSPDFVLSGHNLPVETDASFFGLLAEQAAEYERAHQLLMPLDDAQPHFGLDGMAGWMWPYRAHVGTPQDVEFEVTVRNPLPAAATLRLRLSGPSDWRGSETEVGAEARAEVTTRLSITPSGPCRRQPVAVDLHADGQPFGQVVEALVTVGGDDF